MPYFIYLLKCSDKSYYCGITNNLEKRLRQHNSTAQGARYTKTRRPVELFYFEQVKSIGEALKRERKIKTFSHEAKSKL